MEISPRPVVIGLLSIVALSLAAATLTSPVTVDGDLGLDRGGDAIGEPASSEETVGVPLNTTDREGDGGAPIDLCVEPLAEIPPGVLLLGFVLVGGSLSYALAGPAVAVTVVTIGFWTLVVAILLLTGGCPSGGMEPSTVLPSEAELTSDEEGLIDEGGNGDTQPISVPSIILLAAVAVGVLGVVLGLRDSEGSTTTEDSEESAGASRPVAGQQRKQLAAAATPQRDLPPENTIYQAWTAFTTSLAVSNPQTTTPAEYARIAADAGYDTRAVRELTGIFQAVRYDVVEPTPERSADAVEALRVIAQSVDDETLADHAARLADDE